MRNIKLEIEYEGTDFRGWQIQNSHRSSVAGHRSRTIQETIEAVLAQILQEKVKAIASGRTDSGVHAFSQVVNFKTSAKFPLIKIKKALNSLLPEGISVKKISSALDSFHSCRSARYKTYRYIIANSESPQVFLRKFSWHIPYKLDVPLMRQEARVLSGRHDFKSFCASGSSAKTTVRTIKKISIKISRLPPLGGNLILIDIKAGGFLYNMARNIVGTLVEIGRGRIKKRSLGKILHSKDRKKAGPTAPARGLFLAKVTY